MKVLLNMGDVIPGAVNASEVLEVGTRHQIDWEHQSTHIGVTTEEVTYFETGHGRVIVYRIAETSYNRITWMQSVEVKTPPVPAMAPPEILSTPAQQPTE